MELYFSSICCNWSYTNDKIHQSSSTTPFYDFRNFKRFKKINPFWGFHPFSFALETQPWSLNCLLKPKPIPLLRPPVRAPVRAPVPANVPSQLENTGNLSLTDHIAKLVLEKDYLMALEFFEQVPGYIKISASAYESLIDACVALSSRRFATLLVRRYILEHVQNSSQDSSSNSEFDIFLYNRLIYLHVKCGLLKIAIELFDKMPMRNMVSFSVILSGLVSFAHYWQAIELFESLWKRNSGINAHMFVTILRACAKLSQEYLGLQLHAIIAKNCYFGNSVFSFCALMDMYAKCGRIKDAHKLFDLMPDKTQVAWNVIIAGYALNGYSEKALDLYNEMKMANVEMDMFTYSTAIRVCVQLGSIEKGKEIHADLIRNGFGLNLVVGTALVDLYGKWGRIEDARNVFDQMPRKNVITWNALIGGYSFHGMGQVAIDTFHRMVKEYFVPNHVTVFSVLTACVRSGNFEKGRAIFVNMRNVYGINPRAMHYSCMVDLLGKQGLLNDAFNLIQEAPIELSLNNWAALLRACRALNNIELGLYAAEELYELNPVKLSNYVSLINLYVKKGRANDASRVINEIKNKGWEMDNPYTWIEVKKIPYRFSVRDMSQNPRKDEIYGKIHDLMREIGSRREKRENGKLDLFEGELRDCENHSEKLAIAFGLIGTCDFAQITLVQTHRMCEDCHDFIRLVGEITKRYIVVRDASKIHHFSRGDCSCGDYW